MSQGFDPVKAEVMSRLYDRWLFDVEEKQRIERAAQATGYGFNPYEFARPFPRPTPNPAVLADPPRAPQPAMGMLVPLALSLLLGGGTLGIGAVAVSQLLQRQSPPAAAGAPQPSEYEVIFESSGKQIEVERK